jgi:hypothetical protein
MKIKNLKVNQEKIKDITSKVVLVSLGAICLTAIFTRIYELWKGLLK